jgi:conjugative relaxase-like TrwC/TraI family protein
VVSISKMSAEALASYHTGQSQDELYHSKDSEQGIWQGELVEFIGLNAGVVIGADEFKKISYSIDPRTMEPLIDKYQTVAAFDVTASMPKSASIIAELGTEQDRADMFAAHQVGVDAVRKIIEAEYAGYQTREADGTRGHRHTGKALFSEWLHASNRNGEMLTHTHLVVHNITIDADGKMRSFDARELFKNEYYLGQIYRNTAAAELQNRDYSLTITDREQGFYELSAVPRLMIDHYSSRGAEIEAERDRMREELGRELTKEEHDLCKTATRATKQRVDKNELAASWQESAQQFKIGELKVQGEQQRLTTAEEAVNIAASAMVEKEAIVKKEELYRAALKLGLGSGITLEQIDAAARANFNIIYLDGNRVTTREMSEIESAIIRDISFSRGKHEAILTVEDAEVKIAVASKDREAVTGHALTDGQTASGAAILSNTDSIMIVQGDAGVGKTTMLAEVNTIAIQQGRSIFGAAYTGAAAAGIEAASGIQSQTLHSMLLQKPELPENSIIVVDEASMLGSRQLRELQLYAAESKSKIVLIGDSKQLKGMSGGDMFNRLQEQPRIAQTAIMSESIRAKTSEMKELYQLIKDKQFESAVGTMAGRNELVESERGDAVSSIAAQYDEKTLVIADLNKDRTALNFAIRDKLGFTGGTSVEVQSNITPSGVSRHFAQNYEVDSIVTAQKPIPGMKPGQRGNIVKVDQVRNTITIETEKFENGKQLKNILTLDLYKVGEKINVSKLIYRELLPGEKIIFAKNDSKDLNVRNGQTGIIQSVSKDHMTVLHEDGKIREVDLKKYNQLDYGYCRTVMASQGQSYSKVLGLLDSKVASSNSFYVAVTRAMQSIKFYTEDIEKFKKNAEKMQIKSTTIDHLSALNNSIIKGHIDGRNFIESLRTFTRDGTTKLGNLGRNIEDLVEGLRSRGADAIRYLREYRQSLSRNRAGIRDREIPGRDQGQLQQQGQQQTQQQQPRSTGSASLDRALEAALHDRSHGLSRELSR